jgi:hypothetical protein
MRELSEKEMELLKKVKEAGEKGMTDKEMGELFFGTEDALSDKGLIKWVWAKREIQKDEHKGEMAWRKVCVLSKDGERFLEKQARK